VGGGADMILFFNKKTFKQEKKNKDKSEITSTINGISTKSFLKCVSCNLAWTRYSGHLTSRLSGVCHNMTKQTAFPTIWEGKQK
jgi:hypothetical protein